jgi:hypothetical protein
MAHEILNPADASTDIGWSPEIAVRVDSTITVGNTRIYITDAPQIITGIYDGVGPEPIVGVLADIHTINSIGLSTASYIPNGYTLGFVRITAGTGLGQTRPVTSNTGTTFLVSSNWSVVPDATSRFEVFPVAFGLGLPTDDGRREYRIRIGTKLEESTTYSVELWNAGVPVQTWTFTTAAYAAVPTLVSRYNHTDEDGVQSDKPIQVHPKAQVGATIRPPSGTSISKDSIEVTLDRKVYILRGASNHPDASIEEVYNAATGDYDWQVTIDPKIAAHIRSQRNCKISCETVGGVPMNVDWEWEIDIPGAWPVPAYKFANELPDGFNRELRMETVPFTGGLTNGLTTVSVADAVRWAAILEGMTVKIGAETTTYKVSSKTAPATVVLSSAYQGATGSKGCIALFDLPALLGVVAATGEELARVEQNLDEVANSMTILECDAVDLGVAALHRGVKAPMGLGIDPEQARKATYDSLRFPIATWGSIVSNAQSMAMRPTYDIGFTPEDDIKVYGPRRRVIAQADTVTVVLGSTIVRRTTAGGGTWTSVTTGRDVRQGDWMYFWSPAADLNIYERQVARVYVDGGFEYVELTEAVPLVTVGSLAWRYQIVSRRWPAGYNFLTGATFTTDSKTVQAAGPNFANFGAGWRICPVLAGRLGKWYRIESQVDDTAVLLTETYKEGTTTGGWVAEQDDRAGSTEKTRVVAESGETAAFTAGSAIVTGTNTTWASPAARDYLQPGFLIAPNRGFWEADVLGDRYGFWGEVLTVDSDTQITLKFAAPRTTTTGYRAEWSDPDLKEIAIEVPRSAQFQSLEGGGFVLSDVWGPESEPTTGQATLTNGSANVTGIGTSWTDSVLPGDWITPGDIFSEEWATDLLGYPFFMVIDSIVTDLSLTLAANWPLATRTNSVYSIVRPLYDRYAGLNGIASYLMSSKALEQIKLQCASGTTPVARIVA